jgi:GntR family transcriptional regulator
VASFRTALAAKYIDSFMEQMESLGLTWDDIEKYVRSKAAHGGDGS